MLNRTLLAAALVGLLTAPSFAEPEAPSTLTRPVSFQFQDEDVRTVVKSISQFTGITVTVADGVDGKVTSLFNQVPAITCLRALAGSVDATIVDDGNGGLLIAKPTATAPGSTVALGPPVSFEFKDKRIAQIVTAVAHFAKVNLVFNCAECREKVTIKADKEHWQPLIERVLGDKYSLIDEGGVFRIEPK